MSAASDRPTASGATSVEEELVARARALAPAVAAAASEVEATGALPPDLLDGLHEAGVFRMAVPAAYGGLDASPLTCARVVEELAVADGSVGWCAMIAWQTAAMGAMLPARGAQEVFAGPRSVTCGVARQTGKAHAVDGGYRISGRWPFASGSLHATWFGAECAVVEGDQQVRNSAGDPVGRMFFVPHDQVTIHNTWLTGGLRGTGSNDFSVQDVFVPGHRSFQMLVDPPVLPNPRYRNQCLEFIGHGAQALGVARGLLEAARAFAPGKIAYGGKPLHQSPRFQSDFALAQALVESGRSYLHGTVAAFWDRIQAGHESTQPERARVRLATSLALQNSVRAVDLLYAGAGTSAFFTASPFERRFRDIHAAAAHVMIGTAVVEAAGRVALGLEPEFPFF